MIICPTLNDVVAAHESIIGGETYCRTRTFGPSNGGRGEADNVGAVTVLVTNEDPEGADHTPSIRSALDVSHQFESKAGETDVDPVEGKYNLRVTLILRKGST
jgi:hypothetical protein